MHVIFQFGQKHPFFEGTPILNRSYVSWKVDLVKLVIFVTSCVHVAAGKTKGWTFLFNLHWFLYESSEAHWMFSNDVLSNMESAATCGYTYRFILFILFIFQFYLTYSPRRRRKISMTFVSSLFSSKINLAGSRLLAIVLYCT